MGGEGILCTPQHLNPRVFQGNRWWQVFEPPAPPTRPAAANHAPPRPVRDSESVTRGLAQHGDPPIFLPSQAPTLTYSPSFGIGIVSLPPGVRGVRGVGGVGGVRAGRAWAGRGAGRGGVCLRTSGAARRLHDLSGTSTLILLARTSQGGSVVPASTRGTMNRLAGEAAAGVSGRACRAWRRGRKGHFIFFHRWLLF